MSHFSLRRTLLARLAKRRTGGFQSLPTGIVFTGLGMAPGLYQSHGRLWARKDTVLPEHLMSSKGHSIEGTATRFFLHRRWRGRRSGPTVLLVGREEALLFLPGVTTERVWTTPRATAAFVDKAQVLRSELPAPLITTHRSGRMLRSTWVDGESIHQASPSQRIAAVRTILTALVRISERTAIPDHAGFLQQVIKAGQRGPEGATFSALTADSRLHLLQNAPLTLQHGDPSGSNLLLQVDGSPMIVDWTPATVGLRPFWSDAAHLASIDGYAPLFAGEFDRELARLWRAVGMEPPEPEDLRVGIALGSVLFYAMLGLSAASDGAVLRLRDGSAVARIPKAHKVRSAWENLTAIIPG